MGILNKEELIGLKCPPDGKSLDEDSDPIFLQLKAIKQYWDSNFLNLKYCCFWQETEIEGNKYQVIRW